MRNDEMKINKAIKDACIRSKCIICNKQFDNNDLYRGNFCATQSGKQWRFAHLQCWEKEQIEFKKGAAEIPERLQDDKIPKLV